MRLGFSLVLLFLSEFLSGQDIPVEYHTRYYYKNHDTAGIRSIAVSNESPVFQYLTKQGLVYIPANNWFAEEQNGYDTIHNVTFTFKSGDFFASATEVTNNEYKIFQELNKVPAYFVDTLIWPTNAIESDPYEHYYYQHKAYGNYPVLGVSHWQAEEFCKWKEKEMNAALQKLGIKDIKLHVSLPSDAQWQNLYFTSVNRWLAQQSNPGFCQHSPGYLCYILGSEGYRCQFGGLRSQRLQQLRMPLANETQLFDRPRAAQSLENMGGVYHLLGNAAEWTSTSAQGNLFNTEEYLYTMSGKIVLKEGMRIDSAVLKKRLTGPSMNNHYLVKGGSWKDDIFYLQPAASRFEAAHSSFNDVGFRYIVTAEKL